MSLATRLKNVTTTFSSLVKMSGSAAGGLLGRVVVPVYAAPVARGLAHTTMNWMWGPARGLFQGFVRKGIAEHVGHQAFAYSGIAGGIMGGLAGAAAVQGIMTVGAYAHHKYKQNAYLNGLIAEAKKDTSAINMQTFEMDEDKGFTLNKQFKLD